MRILFNLRENGESLDIVDELNVDELKMLIDNVNATGTLFYNGCVYDVSREECGFHIISSEEIQIPTGEVENNGKLYYEFIAYKSKE